jgi:hypothetical protein
VGKGRNAIRDSRTGPGSAEVPALCPPPSPPPAVSSMARRWGQGWLPGWHVSGTCVP